MKDVEKYETFEDLKKSENIESQTFDNGQEVAEEFIELLRKNSREIENPPHQNV
jgi:ASC-1-like (ASCH) protein